MADKSKIQWTDATLNMIRARNLETGGIGHFCEKVSPGCSRCYAERMQPRFKNAIRYNEADRKLVEVFLDEKVLTQPMRWKRGRKIFVGSMTDLFGDWVTDEMLGEIFAVMAVTPQHTYQVLTKRAERMRGYFNESESLYRIDQAICDFDNWHSVDSDAPPWPLPNLWLGVSVEDQKTADERIPLLLRTQAAVRVLSLEPLLGPVDLRNVKPSSSQWLDAVTGLRGGDHSLADCNSINWVIIGGESGPNARPFDIAWARSIIRQCKDAGVAVFMKQLGAKPYDSDLRIATPRSVIVPIDSDWTFTNKLVDRKGGDWSEWPEDLRIREFPKCLDRIGG